MEVFWTSRGIEGMLSECVCVREREGEMSIMLCEVIH